MQASPLYPHFGVSSPLAAYKTFPPQYRDYNQSLWPPGFQPPFDAAPDLSTLVNPASNCCNQGNASRTPCSTTSNNVNITNNYSHGRSTTYLDNGNVKSSETPPPSLPTPPFPDHNNYTAQGDKTEIDSGEKDVTDWHQFNNASAAFLGPQLWEKPIPCKSDLKLEFMDLDEFLNENDIDEELLKQNLSESPPSLPSRENVSKADSSSSSPGKYTQLAPPSVTTTSSSSLSSSCSSSSSSSGQQPFVPESPSRLQSVVSPPSIEAVLACTDSVSSPVSSSNYPDSPRSSDSPLPSDDKRYLVSSASSFGDHDRPKRKPKSSESGGQCPLRVGSGARQAPTHQKKEKCPLNAQIRFSPTDTVLASVPGEDFDPRTRVFSEDELKPQPMIKKSRKQQYIPNELKDERYWARRRKNNVAAKRSRDARRTKENQIAMRASFLEKENQNLRTELDNTRSLLETLKKRLIAYESG